ncbi:hypothetical protein EDB86DRAFT_3011045 [Lactarius hatsudake]|nr:hypothetical protein EDB86DRAFT_3011045 [Lactarius hatsudake]
MLFLSFSVLFICPPAKLSIIVSQLEISSVLSSISRAQMSGPGLQPPHICDTMHCVRLTPTHFPNPLAPVGRPRFHSRADGSLPTQRQSPPSWPSSSPNDGGTHPHYSPGKLIRGHSKQTRQPMPRSLQAIRAPPTYADLRAYVQGPRTPLHFTDSYPLSPIFISPVPCLPGFGLNKVTGLRNALGGPSARAPQARRRNWADLPAVIARPSSKGSGSVSR